MCTIWEMAETIRAEERKAQETHAPPEQATDASLNEPNARSRPAEAAR